MMIEIATVLFAITALGGAAQAALHYKGKDRPWPLSIAHLILGAAGLVLLAVGVVQRETAGLAGIALILLAFVALGGIAMMVQHAKRKPLAPTLLIAHMVGAVIGLVLLIVDVLAVPVSPEG